MNSKIETSNPERSGTSTAIRCPAFELGGSLFAFVLALFLLPSSRAATVVVEMRSLRFQPADIVINVGDTVIWTNLDSQVHDTVSGTNLVPSGYWASARMGRGQTFAVTFTNIPPGGYGYYCTPHLITFGMRGTVTVIAPPTVTIVAPTNGAEFAIGTDVSLLATATDSDGFVTQVEFFSGTNSLGSVTNPPFSVVLSNVASGNYVLTARATDNGGLVATSTPVVITVEAPPLVNLTAPLSGARFPLGSQILLGAEVFGGSAGVERVEFFADGEKLGEDFAAPYDFNWTPGNARDYVLTATAADFLGQAGTSAPVAIRVFVPESTRPSVTITSAPPNFARLPSPLITIAGTARDNTGVEVVEWQLNNAAFQPAAGTNRWAAQIALAAGQNTIRVRSVDFAGNVSLPATRFLTFVTNSPLTVRTNGRGRVSPGLNGKALEIGKVYSLTALPAAGNIFAGWEGAPFQGARLNFVMQPELVLTANFLTNPFPRVQGAYAGLVLNTNGVTPESSGLVMLQVGSFGAFSGRLILNGTSHSLRGQFSPTGDAKWALPRPSQVPLAIAFRVDLTNSTSSIQGTITDGRWTSEMFAYRNTFNARSNPAPQAGVRAFVFRHADNPAVQAASGTATLAAGGSASLRGSLSDGRRFSFATTMAMDGTTPFYLSLSRGTEVVAGWLRFGAGADAPVSGTPVCARTGTNGFEFDLLAIPAQY